MSSYYTSVEDGGRSRNGDRCSNRSAYIMRSWAKSVERGVFLKNTLTSKKWVVASVTSMEQCQWRRVGLQPGAQVTRLLELAVQWLEQHLGCSKLARTFKKSSCGASNFDFTELWGKKQAAFKSSCVLAHTFCPRSLWRAPLSCGIWGTLLERHSLSTLALRVCAGVWAGDPPKNTK